jgi:RpiB/LacA/LacB family sugar-phosphate isomerase
MKIIIGADHGGFEIKGKLTEQLKKQGHEVKDIGTFTAESCDYPEIGAKVAEGISQKKFERGILICKSGIGLSIVANKFPGVRAALCHNAEQAKLSREHNDANVLVLGAEQVSKKEIYEMIQIWLTTLFESGGRHERRVKQIDEIEHNIFGNKK